MKKLVSPEFSLATTASDRGHFGFGANSFSDMAIDATFERVFSALYGKPCWGVENCIGSDIVFHFGEPHLEIREPTRASPKASRRVQESLASRHVYVRGEWHLWIWLCAWEIFQKGKRVGSDRSRSHLQRVVYSLNGQKLVGFLMDSRGNDCTFEFDLGGLLVTHPLHPLNSEHDQWQLFDPSGHVLTLRGDRRFSYTRSNQPCDAGPWKRVVLRGK